MWTPKNLSTARSIPASIKPKELPAVAIQSKEGSDSKEPRKTSNPATSLAAQRISSAVSLLRVAIIKRMLLPLYNARPERRGTEGFGMQQDASSRVHSRPLVGPLRAAPSFLPPSLPARYITNEPP